MTITLNLSDETLRRLNEQAKQRGKTLDEIVAEIVELSCVQFIDENSAEFKKDADRILDKNAELYRRLA